MKINNDFYEKLDLMVPNPKCSLNYTKDYELLIATVLSAQCTDARVNEVTPVLWSKFDINSLAKADKKEVANIIRPLGNMNKRSEYLIEIASRLVNDHSGHVPNDRVYLESLPGVGRKTANVVLANIFDVPAFAVDTHVDRVSKRLGLASHNDDVLKVEKKLMKTFPSDKWLRLHHQLLLLGRYTCTARNPKCDNCLLKDICKYYKNTNK
ncbi:MAG: endonuclease III [Bacilli bacterium]|nr:endonuclease III [Bacilli bacterium]